MRASLARSLTLDPPLFLFDEPFGALDEITRERLNDELLALFAHAAVRRAVRDPLGVRGGVPVHPRAPSCRRRPGRIVDAIDVPFEYPRSPELRHEPEFARIAGQVSRPLRSVYR